MLSDTSDSHILYCTKKLNKPKHFIWKKKFFTWKVLTMWSTNSNEGRIYYSLKYKLNLAKSLLRLPLARAEKVFFQNILGPTKITILLPIWFQQPWLRFSKTPCIFVHTRSTLRSIQLSNHISWHIYSRRKTVHLLGDAFLESRPETYTETKPIVFRCTRQKLRPHQQG